MLSTMLYCFSYVPLLTKIIQHKKLSKFIPSSTLILTIISALIMMSVCLIKKYYIHFIFFFVLFICSLSILIIKHNN